MTKFDHGHYVPILKLKRAEKAALALIEPVLAPHVTPLFELVEMPQDGDWGRHLGNAFRSLPECTRTYARCFLDLREISSLGVARATQVFERAAAARIPFTPVTGVSRSVDVGPALAHRRLGLALRVTRAEYEDGGLAGRLRNFVRDHRLRPPDVDLIVDLGSVDDLVLPGLMALADAVMAEVPDHGSWRNLILAACAFPLSMAVVDRHSFALIERTDWIGWREHLYKRRAAIARLPTYSDCAIQHPRGVEGFDPVRMQVSATIRYTQDETWLLVKGEGTRLTPPSVQFPRLAKRLAYGDLRVHFMGAAHCKGCKGTQDAADGAPRLGSAEAWRRLGTAHHISTVVRSIRALGRT